MIARIALPLAALMLATGATDPKTETEHVVGAKETLDGIASRAGVPAAVIAEANGLRAPYAVRQGQKLIIPRQRSHTVKKGETGFDIALRYGVPFSNIAIANGLDDKGTVKPGQKLIIPAVANAPKLAALPAAPAKPYFRAPHDGKVFAGYAVRADGKGHDGLDYAANPADMVRASASGTVSGISKADPRLGRKVTIDHGGGWKTAYGHLDKVTVAMGDVVKVGERIGLAGKSGQASRTEVHFAILKDGKPVDPALHLGK